jgi:ribulose-phosphate 3-epimerase
MVRFFCGLRRNRSYRSDRHPQPHLDRRDGRIGTGPEQHGSRCRRIHDGPLGAAPTLDAQRLIQPKRAAILIPTKPNLLAAPPKSPLIFPSIFGADFMRMGDDCETVLKLGAEGLHVDVMDGHFVPNLTMGPMMVQWLRKHFPTTYLDVHLMVNHPAQYIADFAKAGANCITFHIEATLGRKPNNDAALIQQIRAAGCQVGVALNPSAPAETVFHLLDAVDLVLVMSVHPGFSGQAFMPEVLPKVRAIKQRLKPTTRLEMDGGIGIGTARLVREAGCDVIVAASALFGAADRGSVMKQLRGE